MPDLLESIMRPTCLVKEKLQRISCKMIHFRPKITKIKVCTFQVSGKIPDSSWASPRAPLFPSIWPRQRPNIRKNSGFSPFGAGYPSTIVWHTNARRGRLSCQHGLPTRTLHIQNITETSQPGDRQCHKARHMHALADFLTRVTSPKGANTLIFSRFFQPLIYIFHPSSQGPRPGPGDRARALAGACKEGWKMLFFRTGFQAITLPLQDKWASLSLPADPGRVFHPV